MMQHKAFMYEYSASPLMTRVARENSEESWRKPSVGQYFPEASRGSVGTKLVEQAWPGTLLPNRIYAVNHIFSRVTSLESGTAIPLSISLQETSIMVGEILNEQSVYTFLGSRLCIPEYTGRVAGQLYGSLKWHLSLSERGVKDRGIASGVGGIMAEMRSLRRGAESGCVSGEAAPFQGCRGVGAGMGCWGPQTHRAGWVPCSVRCLQAAVSQGWGVGHPEPAGGAAEGVTTWWQWAKAAWFVWWPRCCHWLSDKGGGRLEERTALSRQISMPTFLAELPKCLVWKQLSLV